MREQLFSVMAHNPYHDFRFTTTPGNMLQYFHTWCTYDRADLEYYMQYINKTYRLCVRGDLNASTKQLVCFICTVVHK